ncbi:uncharacterized protein [Palaemon carinicauda]|uniref:uncharacterized protein n=1 Tax=Palaemon carinicauda TaxID=392227 RepID=UPI0035B61E21
MLCSPRPSRVVGEEHSYLGESGVDLPQHSTPDEGDNYSSSTEADVDVVVANGCVIPTHGCETPTLYFGKAKYHWNFLVADVTLPIIGVRFLSNIHILTDVAHRWLVKFIPSDLLLHISAPTDAYAHPLTSYPEVFRPDLGQIPTAPTKRGIYYHLKTTGTLTFAGFWRLLPDHLAPAKQTITSLEEMRACPKILSQLLLPQHIILNKDGYMHQCGDYKYLGMQTEWKHLPFHNIAHITSYFN